MTEAAYPTCAQMIAGAVMAGWARGGITAICRVPGVDWIPVALVTVQLKVNGVLVMKAAVVEL